MGFTSKSRVFDALFRCSNAKLCHYRYKSSYSRDKILRLEEEKKTVEKEISSKYLFRPRLPVLIEHDCFDAPFQYEYDKICRENYAWDSEFSAIKTVWERLKPPPQDEVEENVLLIGNPQTLPWAPNEWCVERAFDCYRNKRDVARIHLTIKYLEMLQKLPTLPFGFMLDIKRHIQQKVLIERTRKLFELVCQTYYTGTLQKLSVSDENAEPIVKRMCEVEQFETSRREMLNITEQDIITVAPGLYGALQDFFRVYFASTYSLSITCCALYQKNILYNVAANNYETTSKQVAIPYLYSYRVPHLIFGNFDYWYSQRKKQFELHDFHILGFSVLPWYKDIPGTDKKFFAPKYERVSLTNSIFV